MHPSLLQFTACIPLLQRVEETLHKHGITVERSWLDANEQCCHVYHEATGPNLKLLWRISFDILEVAPEACHAMVCLQLKDDQKEPVIDINYDPTEDQWDVFERGEVVLTRIEGGPIRLHADNDEAFELIEMMIVIFLNQTEPTN